jgi:CheY-like chemotaxis protein
MLVRLVCWDEELARQRVQSLAGCGFEIDGSRLTPSGLVGQFKKLAPAVVLIDLDRLPSHGREVAGALRQSPSTRHIPIVFAGGAPEKLERIRRELPDAVYVDWKNAARALKKAAANPPVNPAKPVSHMQRYQGSGLITKLGLKPDLKVALIAAPEGFEELVGDWPAGIEIQPRFDSRTELAIWFVRSARELAAITDLLGVKLRRGVSAWICYPKQSGRYKVDFQGNDVRAACLEVGLVDYKICSIDADWSAMKFTRKKA